MKLKLDEKELADLAVDWAMKMYKTKNVSAMYEIKGNAVALELEIIVEDTNKTSEVPAMQQELMKRLSNVMKNAPILEADLTPNFGDTEGLI